MPGKHLSKKRRHLNRSRGRTRCRPGHQQVALLHRCRPPTWKLPEPMEAQTRARHAAQHEAPAQRSQENPNTRCRSVRQRHQGLRPGEKRPAGGRLSQGTSPSRGLLGQAEGTQTPTWDTAPSRPADSWQGMAKAAPCTHAADPEGAPDFSWPSPGNANTWEVSQCHSNE